MSAEQVVTYKDVQIPVSLLGIINHMGSVDEYREELQKLGAQWDLLTILGQIVGTGTNMTGTRKGFLDLTDRLLCQLALENLSKTVQQIGAKAQVAVDILIRNLFERTADIGFLATDEDIRQFIIKTAELSAERATDDLGDPVNRTQLKESMRQALVARFREYTAKYSVYFNIILLDTAGNVLAQMDENSQVIKTADPLVTEAQTTEAEYLEIYRYSDLLPQYDKSLIYAYKVTRDNENRDDVLGVLCLCFRFVNELDGIFKNLSSEDDWSVKLITDKSGSVIASSDKYQVPVGAVVETVFDREYGITNFAGRKYIAKTCYTKGYQGFYGLGWCGHVMIPIENAFSEAKGKGGAVLEDRILEAVMSDPRLFSAELRSIPDRADRIQSDLERTVWNGNVKESDPSSKVLLWSISDTGAKTKKVFEKSINNLHRTVIGSILHNAWFWAALAVDIMDRNLYERSDDCRWWALTSAFRKILDKPQITQEDKDEITSILTYINGLYTVYTNIFVYDAYGRVLAVSNRADKNLVGTVINKDFVRNTLAIKDSSQYSVSDFVRTEFYSDRPTYIYGAAITSSGKAGNVVGGIGIVFDSEPQFRSMLNDALPRDEKGEIEEGVFGIFADRKRTVISSTDETITPGDLLDIDRSLFTMPNGKGMSKIIEYNGVFYAVGAHAASGYREYKKTDGYVNDVISLIFTPLARVQEQKALAVRRRKSDMQVTKNKGDENCMEVATFFIGDKWLGIRTELVVEAVDTEGLTTVPGSLPFVKGRRLYNDVPILVVDIRSILGLPEKEISSETQIIIIKAKECCLLGLIVDALGEIPEVCMDRVETSDHILDRSTYTESIIKPDENDPDGEMLMVLKPDGIVDSLRDLL